MTEAYAIKDEQGNIVRIELKYGAPLPAGQRYAPVTVSEKGEADDVLRGIRLKVASLHDKMLSDEYRTALRNEVLERIDAYLSRRQG